MPNEIRILYIEDMPADVAMVNGELRRAGLAFRAKRVDSREAFLHELENEPPDVILSDHGLPSFDGFTALAIARDRCPEIPFIFVTGSLGENMAIESFESGATDYVLKDGLARLAPAVRRALRHAEERNLARRQELALRESEERFRMLVEGVKDYAIFMLDPDGKVTSWNAGAQWLHGYRSEEIQGREFSLFYRPEDVAEGRPKEGLRTAAARGRLQEEGWRVGKSGQQFWAHVAITALRDEGGRLRGFAHATRNVTERKASVEALRKSESLKSAILETALDAILSIDENGMVQEWNPAAERIFGYGRAEALGRPMDELIIPSALREVYRDGLTNYLVTGVGSLLNRPIEMTLKRAEGSEFRAEMAITRIPTEDPPRCTALIRDITERKQAESALKEAESRFRRMVEDVQDYAIYMLDTEGRVATWNAGAERIKGYLAEEILGKSFAVFFSAEDVQQGAPMEILKKAGLEGKASHEGWRVRKDGSRFLAQGILTALHDDAGALCGFSEVARDVTKQAEAEAEIHRLNEQLEHRVRERTAQLEAANQELEAFSYSVSHDLRAPLRHIAGYIEILRSESGHRLDESGLQHLQTVSDSAARLGALIDALLAFSRMGRAEMQEEKVKLGELYEEARRDLRGDIQGRVIEWKTGDLHEARCDPVMLRQVFVNLLSNALKFTQTRPRAQIEASGSDTGSEIIFSLRDNGVGFDMRHAGKLFGVFQRLHPAREFGGTGIGLANVRRIILRHGGRVWAEGEAGRGATFYFSIPKH